MEVKVLFSLNEKSKFGCILQNNNIVKKCVICNNKIEKQEIFVQCHLKYSTYGKNFCINCVNVFEKLSKANENLIFK